MNAGVADRDFYKNLPAIKRPIPEVFSQGNFIDFPPGWHVIIADVKNSTSAVNAGKHDDVNLVSAGCLVVALNIAKGENIQIPFFFTGDGGTMFVPPDILEDVLKGLKVHNQNIMENFGLELHIGSIAVSEILAAGHSLSIAKVQFAKNFHKAVIIGNGLLYAEQLIKGTGENTELEESIPAELNMEGLECRWNKIKPPEESDEVVCYLIQASSPDKQIIVYADVLRNMDEIYGKVDIRNPLSIDGLKLLISVNKIKKEMIVRFGKWRKNYITKIFLQSYIGKLFFKLNWKINQIKGKEYLKQVVTNADTLTIDGRISTIISGSKDQRIRFVQYLKEQEQAGKLFYGHFKTGECIMTCYIENRNNKHIHFVDGADGGYTEASKELKSKLHKYVIP